MPALLTELKYFFFFVLVAVTCRHNMADLGPTRNEMIHYLLDERRYDPSLPPDDNTGKKTTVSVELFIYDLNSESDIAMEYDCTLYMRMNWTDTRLDYTKNKTSFDIIDLGDTIVDKTWVPDLYFHHARKAEMHGLFTKNQLLYIFKNGSVLYSGRFNIKWHCQMNFFSYPFNEPECPIIIQSYSLSKDYLILKWNENTVVIDDKVKNLEAKSESMKQSYHSPYSNPVASFSTLEATLVLPRPKLSLCFRYIVPVFLFSGMSLVCFLFGNEVSLRITITIGALIQNILLWRGIYDQLPATYGLTLLEGWMLGNLVFIAIVFVVNAVMCSIIFKKKEEEQKQNDKDNGAESNRIGRNKSKTQRISNAQSRSTNEQSLLLEHEQVHYEAIENQAITNSTNDIPMEGKNLTRDNEIDMVTAEAELKEDFLELLEDNENITTSTKWDIAKCILKDDPRFTRASENCKVEQWYKDYIDENAKEDFRTLMEEKASGIATWRRASMKIDHDPRYKTLTSAEMRKQVFAEYRLKIEMKEKSCSFCRKNCSDLRKCRSAFMRCWGACSKKCSCCGCCSVCSTTTFGKWVSSVVRKYLSIPVLLVIVWFMFSTAFLVVWKTLK